MRTNTGVPEGTVMALVTEALVGTLDREFVSAGVSVEEAGVGEEGGADIPGAEVCTQELPRRNQCSVHPLLRIFVPCHLPETGCSGESRREICLAGSGHSLTPDDPRAQSE